MGATKPKGLGEKVMDAVAAANSAAAKLLGGEAGDGNPSNEKVDRAEEFAERANEHLDRAQADDAASDYESAKLNQVEGYDLLPESGALHLRFVADGAFLPDAEPIAVERSDLKADNYGGTVRAIYNQPVRFELHASPALVSEAWLIAGNGDAVRCDLGTALPTGGGHDALIPSGSLLF